MRRARPTSSSAGCCADRSNENLADDETSRVKIAEAGGLEPLVRLCTGSTDDTVLESAAAAIANLAYNENNRKRLAQVRADVVHGGTYVTRLECPHSALSLALQACCSRRSPRRQWRAAA